MKKSWREVLCLAIAAMLWALPAAALGEGYAAYTHDSGKYSVAYPAHWTPLTTGSIGALIQSLGEEASSLQKERMGQVADMLGALSSFSAVSGEGSLRVSITDGSPYASYSSQGQTEALLSVLLTEMQAGYTDFETIHAGSVYTVDERPFLYLSGLYQDTSVSRTAVCQFFYLDGGDLYSFLFTFPATYPVLSEAEQRDVMDAVLESFEILP